MKTASKIFYLGAGDVEADSIDAWVESLPGKLHSVSVAQHGSYGAVVVAMYSTSKPIDRGPL